MNRKRQIVSKLTLTLLAAAACMAGQGLTISARPGLVNYVEGEALLNGKPINPGTKDAQYLNANDTFQMNLGKAEILLMPGTFLRVGDGSLVRMILPTLLNPRLELEQGEAMIEIVSLLRGSQVEVLDHGALIILEKNGLYRITAGLALSAAVIEGSAQVSLLSQKLKLGQGRQTNLFGPLESERFDLSLDDDLYAWSSVRSQYNAAASYDAATTLAAARNYSSSGWFFDSMLDCWAWIPSGRSFSPFGWGFYSPVTVGSATVVKCPVVRGGHWHERPGEGRGGHGGDHDGDGHRHWVGIGSTRTVAINPKHPPSISVITGSPAANHEARTSAFRDQLSRAPASRAETQSGFAEHGRNSSSAGTPTHVENHPSAWSGGHNASPGTHATTGAGSGYSHTGNAGAGGATHTAGSGGGGGSHSGGGGFSGGGGGGASHMGGGASAAGGGASHASNGGSSSSNGNSSGHK